MLCYLKLGLYIAADPDTIELLIDREHSLADVFTCIHHIHQELRL